MNYIIFHGYIAMSLQLEFSCCSYVATNITGRVLLNLMVMFNTGTLPIFFDVNKGVATESVLGARKFFGVWCLPGGQ